MILPKLTIAALQAEAALFAREESVHSESSLYGVTDGRAVSAYIEQKLRAYVASRYEIVADGPAKAITFPELNVDVHVTSEAQPQSLCPFKSARQKVFGLGYSLLVFLYDKTDDGSRRTSQINIRHTIFLDASATGDFTTTYRLREMISDGAGAEDIIAYFMDRNLPVDEIEALAIAEEVLRRKPAQGYITISNVLQWRLQYTHAVRIAGTVAGVARLGK